MSYGDELAAKGYTQFAFDPRLAAWAAYAASASEAVFEDPAHDKWWRHQRTWFVGVDALPNDERGQLPGGPPLAGKAIDFVHKQFGFSGPWHRGQLSVCFPGYPQRDATESAAQHNFRLKQDAAHVDGLHAEGLARRRHFREAHQFILGIPINATTKEASPFVVWEGSHFIMADMFKSIFADLPTERHADADVTDAYHAARKRCFETCRRTIVYAQPGQSYIVHKHALHGVAPWTAGSGETSRMIAYFRPTSLSPIAISR
jgi:hypothetical protein